MARRKKDIGGKKWCQSIAERCRQLFEEACAEPDKERRRVLTQVARGLSGLLGQASKKLLDSSELEARVVEAEKRMELITAAGRGEGSLKAV